MKLISLTTDFGTRDWFVGTMKGVIAGIAPGTGVVDLTHEIPPGDIHAGAFSLLASYAFFPPGTIHVVVIDPGVGSERKPIAVKTARYVFVGPDNGVLSWALEKELVLGVRLLENRAVCLEHISNTFHGRDIFSPAAAHLSNGTAFESVGPAARTFQKLDCWAPIQRPGKVEGRIIYIDHFGNGITNIPNPQQQLKNGMECRVKGKRLWTVPYENYFQAVPVSAAVAVPGSSGYLEVAVNAGSAEKILGLKRGCSVVLQQATRKS